MPELARLSVFVSLASFTLGGTVATQGDRARPVTVVETRRAELVKKTLLQAEVFAFEAARLTPRVTGRVERVLVEPGDPVEHGEPLVEIACPELVAQLAIVEAALARARARVVVAEQSAAAAGKGVEVAQADLTGARTNARADEVAAELVARAYTRAKNLHQQNAATLEEVEQRELEYARAKAKHDSSLAAATAAHARVEQSRAIHEVRRSEWTQMQAEADEASAEVEKVRVLIGFQTVSFPYPSGRVTSRLVDPGAHVMADETPVLEIQNVARVRIRFGVPETEAPLVRAGTKLRIVRPGSGAPDIAAQVTRVAGALDPRSRAMHAEVVVDNQDGRWLPGALCQVELEVLRVADAITVPSAALEQSGADTAVWVVDSGAARKVPVRIGLDLGQRVQVLDGLNGGEQVIVSGKNGLRRGDKVRATVVESGS